MKLSNFNAISSRESTSFNRHRAVRAVHRSEPTIFPRQSVFHYSHSSPVHVNCQSAFFEVQKQSNGAIPNTFHSFPFFATNIRPVTPITSPGTTIVGTAVDTACPM